MPAKILLKTQTSWSLKLEYYLILPPPYTYSHSPNWPLNLVDSFTFAFFIIKPPNYTFLLVTWNITKHSVWSV